MCKRKILIVAAIVFGLSAACLAATVIYNPTAEQAINHVASIYVNGFSNEPNHTILYVTFENWNQTEFWADEPAEVIYPGPGAGGGPWSCTLNAPPNGWPTTDQWYYIEVYRGNDNAMLAQVKVSTF